MPHRAIAMILLKVEFLTRRRLSLSINAKCDPDNADEVFVSTQCYGQVQLSCHLRLQTVCSTNLALQSAAATARYSSISSSKLSVLLGLSARPDCTLLHRLAYRHLSAYWYPGRSLADVGIWF